MVTAGLTAAALTALLTAGPLPARASTIPQWALDYLKAAQAWQITKGAGVTVAVIDSGVTPVADLRPNLLTGHDFVLGSTNPDTGQVNTDTEEHGTEIASLIAGTGVHLAGLAPEAKVLPVRDLLENKLGDAGETEAKSIRYAIAQHVQVINISQGSHKYDQDEAAAVAAAEQAGIVVVAAAGNDLGAPVDYPAAYPGVLAVTAVDQTAKLAFFSNKGPQVSLAAPGTHIYADNNLDRQVVTQGTSMACAYVSAAAALIRAAHPAWTAGQVIRDLIDTASPGAGQAPGQRDDRYGYGIVDLMKALTAPAPSATTSPLPGAARFQATARPSPVSGYTPLPTPTAGRVSAARRVALGTVFLGVPLAIFAATALLIVAARRRQRARRWGGHR